MLDTQKLPRYARQVSVALKKKLQDLAEESPAERADLSQEVDMARMLVDDALKLYDQASSGSASASSKAMAITVLKEALDFVSKITAQMVKSDYLSAEKISIKQLDYFVAQIGRIITEEFGEDSRVAKVLKRIESVTLPDDPTFNPQVTLSLDGV